jgi:quercetin dioxygenase-like cupin family protein
LKPGDTEKKHFHPRGEELFVVVKGKMKVVIEGEEFLLEKGDFVFEKAKTNEAIIKVLEPTTIIAVRTPSVPDNKIYVK